MNITCKICNRPFNTFRSLGSHTTQYHKISKEEYYLKYIDPTKGTCKRCGSPTRFNNLSVGYSRCCGNKCAKLLDSLDPNYRKKISLKTKEAMWKDDIREKYILSRQVPLSAGVREKMSLKAKQRCTDKWKKNLYTLNRNRKISDAKKLYWENNPDEKIRIGKLWILQKEKNETEWRKRLLTIGKIGFKKLFNGIGTTKLEKRMYEFMDKNDIKYHRQYELEYKIFDAYLPNFNILLEFDGIFWHKQSLDECKYDFQIKKYHNDRRKEDIAKKHGIQLFRIRENEPSNRILQIISSLSIYRGQ